MTAIKSTIDTSGLISSDAMGFINPTQTVTITDGQQVTVEGTGKGITYVMAGNDFLDGAQAGLNVSDAKDFKGSIEFQGAGWVTLGGIDADSYSIKGDILSLYFHNKVVDKVTVSGETTSGGNFAVGGDQLGSGNYAVVALTDVQISAGFPRLSVHT